MEGSNLTECAGLAFILATLAGVVVGSLAGFEFGCFVSFIVGFGIFINLGKIT